MTASPNDKHEAPRPPAQPVPLQGRIDNETAEGIYSNIASIMFNRSEFYVDFGRLVPGKQEVKVHARIITSPAHAKDLARVLTQNIQQYEEKFGPIPGDPGDGRKVGF
jgi:uncharacterized protein DUF3467